MSPETNFIVQFLVSAVKHKPGPLLFPMAMTILWSLWCVIAGNREALKRGLKVVAAMLVIATLAAVMLLFSSLGSIGGGTAGRAMEAFAVLLMVVSVLSYYAIIPILLVVSWKAGLFRDRE